MAPYASVRKCRWCDSPAKIRRDKNGINKGYNKTCGSPECLSRNYTDKKINEKRKYSQKKICEICGKEYMSTSHTQKWCKDCVPNRKFSQLFQRYGITLKEYIELEKINKGICPICNIRKATVVDHDHNTGKVRGLLCSGCNNGLHYIETDYKLKNALNYLKGR